MELDEFWQQSTTHKSIAADKVQPLNLHSREEKETNPAETKCQSEYCIGRLWIQRAYTRIEEGLPSSNLEVEIQSEGVGRIDRNGKKWYELNGGREE